MTHERAICFHIVRAVNVYNDANNFLKLCKSLNVVPDIWSLHEWSVWLTPTEKRPKRFETVFYLVGVNEQPEVSVKNDEVHNAWWLSPNDILEQNSLGKIWLPPPQHYELSRLSKESDIEKLLPFAKCRSENSTTTLIFPIQYHTTDGLLNCYPGDDFYPSNPDYSKTAHNLDRYADKTCEQCREIATNLHRAEIKSIQDVTIFQNIRSLDDHLSAQTNLPTKL